MANSLMSFLGGFAGGGNGSIFMQAVGSFMRGERPEDFLQNLARTRPELQGIDLTDINGAAHKLCQERGIDEGKLTAEVGIQNEIDFSFGQSEINHFFTKARRKQWEILVIGLVFF